MNIIRFTTYLLLTILTGISGQIQALVHENIFNIKYIGFHEGLSDLRVYSVIEDKDGVIWIATKAGIDRYNGYNMKNYTLASDYHYGDMGGRCIKLRYDDRFGLWAYDNTGKVFHYSIENDRFEQVLHLSHHTHTNVILNDLYFDQEGTMWLGANVGLYKQKKNEDIVQMLDGYYVSIITSAEKDLYVGTTQGILQLTPDDRALPVAGGDISALHYDQAKNELWAGTFNSGLLIIDLSTGDTCNLRKPESVFLRPIRAITPYDTQTTLLGFDGGGVYAVNRFDRTAKLLMNAEDDSPNVLKNNGIYAVTKDRQGNIWTGSYSGGVSVSILLSFPIQTFIHKRGTTQSLANNNVNDIKEGDDGDLWFATDNGISIQNARTKHWQHELKGTVVVNLCKGANGSMWATTYGNGIYQLDAGGRIAQHLTKQDGLSTNYVFSIKQDMEGDVWAGALNGNLQVFSGDGHLKHTYPDIQESLAIVEAGKHHIAVGTTDGFFLIDKRNNSKRHYARTSEWKQHEVNSYIATMLFNDDHTVWLGTEGGGINLYNMQDGTVKTYTTRDGLPSNDVYSLQRDSRGRLWASTRKGIAIVDDGRISSLNYVEDVEKVYNKSSFTCLSNGEFVYGSSEGAILIDPAAISVNDYQAPLRFTGITITGHDADEAEQLPPRLYHMITEGNVSLDYAHNTFTVTFEAINYRFRHDIVYQYMLDGYEKTWNSPTPDGEARYIRVSPGSYQLKVRCLRQSDGKVMEERALHIEISQPWWNSWWAWMLYACLSGSLFWFFLQYKSNHLQKKYDEDKIQFFINTVHNIRTPVTLIMAPLEDLQKEQGLSADARYFIRAARNNTHRLNTLVTQLLEFEKMDMGQKQLSLIPLRLNDIVEEEAANFRTYCEKKGVQLKVSVPDEEVCTLASIHLMEMLLDNLLSNACKYTPGGGHVSLRLSATRHKAIIEVEDDGIGIPRKAQKHLFHKAGRLENARQMTEEGTGFGLLQVQRIVQMLKGRITLRSEEGRGSLFTIALRRTDESPVAGRTVTTATEHTVLPPEPDRPEEKEGEEKSHTLLIVEDHEELRRYLRKTFEHDYHIIDVDDGQKALECLGENYPDLILSDVMMPGLTGDELCRRVKANPDTAGIPFVLLTAKAQHDDVVKGLQTGADDYIPKPFSTEILKLKVQGLIDTRDRLRRYYMSQTMKDTGDSRLTDADDTAVSAEPEPVHNESDQRFIRQATRVVAEHMADPDFDINALCREMAMSRTLFYSRLKSLTGNGPQEFIRLIRLNRAAELLRQGLSVTDAAADTGFANVKYFSSLFKKQYGVQPSKYTGHE